MTSVYIAFPRETGGWVARAVYQDLRANGYDVCMDVDSAHDEATRAALLEQVAGRAYFVAVLTPFDGGETSAWFTAQVDQAAAAERTLLVLRSPNMTSTLGPPLDKARALAMTYTTLPETLGKLRVQMLRPTGPEDVPPALPDVLVQAVSARQTVSAGGSWLAAQEAFERAFRRNRGDSEGRIADYTEAIRLNPEFAEAYARRAANLDIAGDLDAARADCDTAIRLRPDLEIVYVNRGIIRAQQEDMQGAIEDYTTALRLNPTLAAAYFNRGMVKLRLDDASGAVEDFDAAVRLSPATNYLYQRAFARAQAGEHAAAILDYNEVIRRDPTSAETYYNRGVSYARSDLKKAVEDWTEAIRLKPDFMEAYYNRGMVRANLMDVAGTIEDMSKVLEFVPENEEVRRLLAQIEQLRRLSGNN